MSGIPECTLIEVHLWPDEAKPQITAHPPKKGKWRGGGNRTVFYVSNKSTPPRAREKSAPQAYRCTCTRKGGFTPAALCPRPSCISDASTTRSSSVTNTTSALTPPPHPYYCLVSGNPPPRGGGTHCFFSSRTTDWIFFGLGTPFP